MKTGAIDLQQLERDRDQLWAQAVALEAQGISIRLDEKYYAAAREQQEERLVEDPFEELLFQHLSGRTGKVHSAEIWALLEIPQAQRSQAQNSRLGNVMQSLGWTKKKVCIRGIEGYGYVRGTPEEQLIPLPLRPDPSALG